MLYKRYSRIAVRLLTIISTAFPFIAPIVMKSPHEFTEDLAEVNEGGLAMKSGCNIFVDEKHPAPEYQFMNSQPLTYNYSIQSCNTSAIKSKWLRLH